MLEVLDEAIEMYAQWVPYAMLLSARVGVAFVAMPAPFGGLLPVRIRAAVSFMVALLLAVAYAPAANLPMPVAGISLLGAGFGEALVGGVIGLTVRMTLAAAEAAGTVASFAMGLGFATSVDPNYGESSAPPTQLLAFLSTLIFFVFEGHHAVVGALGHSVVLLPPGRVLGKVFNGSGLSMGGQMMARGLQIAGPVLGTMMIVQIGLALTSRAAPKVHLMYLSFAISIGAGVLTLFVAAPSLATAIVMEVRRLPELLAQALGAA